MTADNFASFVHKIQDTVSLNMIAFEEESKSEVDLSWIWKDNEGGQQIVQPLKAVQMLPPLKPVQMLPQPLKL